MTRVNERRLGFRAALRALVLGALALASCGKSSGGPGSGETHFLQRCDATCAGGYECLCGVCTKPCDDDLACSDAAGAASCTTVDGCVTATPVCDLGCTSADDCAGLGSDFSCNAGVCRQQVPALTCSPGCFAVTGYPRDAERSCADLTRGEEVACQCGEPAQNSSCFARVSDGSVWMVPDGEFQDGGWDYCSPAQHATLAASCDFVSCEVQPTSFCTPEDTCSGRPCGNYQSFEDGCARLACETDSECPADERCVKLQSIDVSMCTYSVEGVCNCGGPSIDLPGAFCNSTSETGPGGEWQSFHVTREVGPCELNCLDEWAITPDGAVATMKGDEVLALTLEDEDKELLAQLIDGPELRRRLRDDEPCVAEDLTITFSLDLPDQLLTQEVTSCLPEGDSNDVYAQLWQMVQKY